MKGMGTKTIIMWFCTMSLLLLRGSIAFETASFYGASYITVPLQEAKSTTELQFRFRTKQADALIFLAAGRTDYCLIRLQNGKLKVRINLGAGESEISSPKGLRFDDLIWHLVSLNRREGEVNVTVDKIHNIKAKLPGRFFELNIYDGLFLGGSGDSLDLFLGHFDWLRGCLSSVFYNGMDVLKRARFRTYQADAHGVTWSCASEFDASYANEISFMEEGAYLALPNPMGRMGVRWQFELKTLTPDAILFYSSKLVVGGRTDYVGLQLTGRKLKLIVDTGGGTTEVANEEIVADGEWHLVAVQINSVALEITIDGRYTATAHVLSKSSSRYLDLSEVMYVGGLELNKRANALAAGMKWADKSLKGCLRNMEADGRLFGIPNAKITQGILPNCVWSYPCTKNPCISGAVCSQRGIDSFNCECDQLRCVSDEFQDNFKNSSKISLPLSLEILSLSSVRVLEGDNALITTENANVILDYAKYGIRDAGVIFNIVQHPQHGVVSNGIMDVRASGNRGNITFTLLDLANDKIHYIHDSSENYNDTIGMELEFSTNLGFILPPYLQGRSSFILQVEVTPVNDPPVLLVPRGKQLRLAQGTRKVLPRKLLNATDPDNPNYELIYTVRSKPKNGFFEKLHLKQSVDTFSQADVDDGQIVYYHANNNTGEYTAIFEVSDGLLSSADTSIYIAVYPLELKMTNNTGLILPFNSRVLISSSNLTFDSNADDPYLVINFSITEAPKYGSLQCLLQMNDGKDVWKNVAWFTNQQIARNEVAYKHSNGTPESDSFLFKVSSQALQLPDVYELKITFVQLELLVARNETIQMKESQSIVVKSNHLKVITRPLTSNESSILYELTRATKVGDLLLRGKILQVNDTWTQSDVETNLLSYRLHYKTYLDVEDEAIFKASIPQCQPMRGLILKLSYQASESLKKSFHATTKSIQIMEGGQQPLLLENLNVLKENLTFVVFRVLEGPRYGWLDMHDVDHTTVEKRRVTQFTNGDIAKQKVTYTHDDSETQKDSIRLVAVASAEDFQCVLQLDFDVSLKNDNPPHRILNTGLSAVRGQEKLLTRRNLWYGDNDVDSKAENIIYTRGGITNGVFMLAHSPHTELREFTQDDIDNKKVMFRHDGEPESNVTLWVSDGVNNLQISFETRGGEPFVHIVNNSKLVLRQGGQAIITSQHLYADTNVNIPEEGITFKVLEGPKDGALNLDGARNPSIFNQNDVDSGRLSYQHSGNENSLADGFAFVVNVQYYYQNAFFQIKVLPPAYWEPLVVINNKTVYVDESTSIVVTNNDLSIGQSNVPPSDIVYFVRKSPKHGYLEIDGGGWNSTLEEASKDGGVQSFDQAAIDDGKLHYIQVASNKTHDKLTFDVTNGMVYLRNLALNFAIIPERLYIGGGEIRVDEGGRVTLPATLFRAQSTYFFGKITEYKVRKAPRHGWLRLVPSDGMGNLGTNVTRWTVAQLQHRMVEYVHDGSETKNDAMVISAYTGEKESVPAKVVVAVEPVDDETPSVINNTGAVVWRGGNVGITSTQLAASDTDTPGNNLTFVVISAQAGFLALTSNVTTPLDQFTQTQVDCGNVIFVHSGDDSDGEFDFVVNDGSRASEPATFSIIAQTPLIHLTLGEEELRVFPQLRKPLTAQHLSAWGDNDGEISYVVKSTTKLGYLTMLAGESTPIFNFTQRDVNTSRIWYQHTAKFNETAKDSFTFDVLSDFSNPIINQMLTIQITVSSGGLDNLLKLDKYEVKEGGSVKLVIDTSNMTKFLSDENVGLTYTSLEATLIAPPYHGTLCTGEKSQMCHSDQTFTEAELNAGLTYEHDHSDSTNDTLTLTLVLQPSGLKLCDLNIPIHVSAINDQPFFLQQEEPSIRVVQNEEFVIGPEQLMVNDADTPPENITYDIIHMPDYGSLYVRGNDSAWHFTQADVNAGDVVYRHEGFVQANKFHFRVSDGQFSPVYKMLKIFVDAATLKIEVKGEVKLVQGTNSTILSKDLFLIKSNRGTDSLIYKVTSAPRYGYISKDNKVVTTFIQTDLKGNMVFYVQSDPSVADDWFELSAEFPFERAPIVEHVRVNASVEPMIKIGDFSPNAGGTTAITADILNASCLAKLTNSNPVFKIIRKPKWGKVKKIVRSSGDAKGQRVREVTKFTQEEVNNGVIYYAARKGNGSEDSFAFLLSAASVQPAVGQLRFHVVEGKGQQQQTKLKTTVKPKEGNSDVEIITITEEYYLTASMLVAVVVLSVVIVCLVRCKTKKRAEDGTKKGPLPLPMPPEDLMSPSPYPQHRPQGDLFLVSDSDQDFNLRYPYGAPDDDWNSYDTSGYSSRNTNNPMLRKNQYWV